jgi:hypothetical protein
MGIGFKTCLHYESWPSWRASVLLVFLSSLLTCGAYLTVFKGVLERIWSVQFGLQVYKHRTVVSPWRRSLTVGEAG